MKHLSPASRYLLAGVLTSSFVTALPAQTRKTTQATDWQIEAKVQQALKDDHAFVGSSILSSVNNGVVKLTGNVRSEAEKELVSTELGNITGVKTVLNNLNIVDNNFHSPPAPKPIAGPTGPKVITLPVGTTLSVRIADEIDTKTTKASDIFHGTTASTVLLNGFTLIPTGTPVKGRVIDAKAAGRFSGAAELSVELVSLRLPGGNGTQDVSLVTQPVSSKAAGRGTNTAMKTGGGAALGAVIGAVASGGTGAGIGALSGGALGGGSNGLSRGKEIDVKPEQLVQFHTSAPLEVTIMLVDGHQIIPAAATNAQLQTRPAEPSAAPPAAQPQQ